MTQLILDKLNPAVAQKIKPFFKDVLAAYPENIHSIYVVGSALTEDYQDGRTDLNSIFVLQEMDLRFLSVLAPLGRKARKDRIAAPLIMTPEYIRSSTDVFPVEFLNFKSLHETVYGEDLLDGLEIVPADLRQQCEREIKANLIGLRQAYLSSLGNAHELTARMVESLPASFPLFRGILMLTGETPPIKLESVLDRLGIVAKQDCSVFNKLLKIRAAVKKVSDDRAQRLFADVYTTTERLSQFVDQISL